MRQPLSALMGTHRWRPYVVAAMASAMLAAAAVCGSPGQQAAPTVPGTAPPSAAASAPTVSPPALPSEPPPVVRTPIPGAAKGGLFADGVTNVARVATATWKTYSNTKYGFTFKYPADWQFAESDNSRFHGPNGEPYYPLESVIVKNPATEQGKKIPGVNCTPGVAPNDCVGAPPGLLGFAAAVWNTQCGFAGTLIVSDVVSMSGRQGARCVVEYPNDKTRTVAIAFALAAPDYLVVELDRGNAVTPAQQAVLETVLSTFAFLPAPLPGATP